MAGIVELDRLLDSMTPSLSDVEYVFLSIEEEKDYAALEPLATFREKEGLSLIVTRARAEEAGIEFDASFRLITLLVHSSLEAVGLTAAVSGALAEKGISANMVAAFYHDHLFVPSQQADKALAVLQKLSS